MRAACCCVCLLLFSYVSALPCHGQPGGSKPPKAAKGEILVRFRDMNAEKLRALIRTHDLDRSHRLGGVERLYRFRSRSKTSQSLLAAFTSRSDVVYAEPNFVVEAVQEPNDPRFAELWNLHNTGQSFGFPAGTPGADIGALAAWEISTGSADHVVAVIDTGIDYTHPDLQPNMWSAPAAFTITIGGSTVTCPAGSHGFNAINFTCDAMDDNRHGTHVSGTIGAAGNNSLGVAGVNWTTRLMAIKFLDANGSGYISDAVSAIEFAIQAKQTSGAEVRVLSNSWGGGGFSQALLDEINRAGENGMLFVAAAGNNGYDNDLSAFYPASYKAANLIAVAATDNNDALASWSNYGGRSVQLGAPGVNILSTLLGGQYGYLSGTSMAAPHISGAAALLLSRCALDTAALKTTLAEQVDLVPDLTGVTLSGGRLNVNKALRDCTAPVGLSPGALAFPRQVVNTASAPRTVTISNRQNVPLELAGVSLRGDFLLSDDCGQQLPANSKCALTVSFHPAAQGYASGELTVTHNAANSPQVVQLSGYAIVAGEVSPQNINFAGIVLGASSRPAYIKVTNNQADAALAISNIGISGAFTLTDNCGSAVAPLQSCNLLVTFTPTALGAHTGALTISHNAGNSPFTVALAGTGVPRVTVSPAALDFGGVVVGSASLKRTATLMNSQKTTLLVSSLAVSGDFAQTSNCIGQIGPGVTCAISITFKPTALGPRSGAIAIAENTPESPHVLSLSGTGLGRPDLAETSASALGTLTVGKATQVSDVAINQGAGAAGASVTRYYLSSVASAVPKGTLLSGTRAVPALAAGESSSGTATVTVSPYFLPGSYYLLACADDSRNVIESNETNNCVASAAMVKVEGPDLVEISVSVAGLVRLGQAVQVTDTTVNQGVANAGASSTRYYLSKTVSSVPAGILLSGTRNVPALVPGALSTGTATVTISPYAPAGPYYILACADANRYVAEVNENNNCTASDLVQVSSQ